MKWAWILVAIAACSGDAEPAAEVDGSAEVAEVEVDGAAEASEIEASEVEVEVVAECDGDEDCRQACAEGRCEAGRCTYVAGGRGCFIADACVDAGAPSAERACFFCNPFEDVTAYSAIAFSESFEVGGGRLVVEKLTPSPASWTISNVRAASGARSLYFGEAGAGTYDVAERAAARASTPALTLPAVGVPLTLSFQLFADTEETPGFDRLSVIVIKPDSEPRVAWSSDEIGGTTMGVFLPITVELGSLAPGERVAFEADSVDEKINGFEGFYVDDVRLRSRCCDATHGCDDGNACTTDLCGGESGECSYVEREGCCLADVDCDDGDPCSADRCDSAADGGVCVSTPREDCCATALDCDDSDPCTEDACVIDALGAGSCKQVPLCCERAQDCEDADSCTIGECLEGQCRYRSACCREDVDCDDGVACTLDTCSAGVCTNAFTYETGCCIPDVLTERFDGGSPAGWTLSPPANNVGWRVQNNATAPSGAAVLYYGHPTLGFYESGGRNTGTATSKLVRLPDGVELRLTFQVLLDVEANPQRDLFRVEAIIGNTTVALVDKAELTRGSWQEVAVDLTWAASQAVQIRFVFDTVDGAQNTTRGIFIDDVRLLSSCLPRRCGVSAECGSRAECIEGTCDEGVCRFGGGC